MGEPSPAGRRHSVVTFGVRSGPMRTQPGHVDFVWQWGPLLGSVRVAIASTDAEWAARDHPEMRRSRARSAVLFGRGTRMPARRVLFAGRSRTSAGP